MYINLVLRELLATSKKIEYMWTGSFEDLCISAKKILKELY